MVGLQLGVDDIFRYRVDRVIVALFWFHWNDRRVLYLIDVLVRAVIRTLAMHYGRRGSSPRCCPSIQHIMAINKGSELHF